MALTFEFDQRGSVPYFRRPARRVSGSLPYHLPAEMAGLFEGRGPLAILDIGCGHAQNRDYFHQRGHRYVGLDIENATADVRGNALTLPFLPQSFDAVISIGILQYVWSPHQLLCEAHRVLKPCGTLSGTAAFLEPWTYGGLMHLSPGGLVELIARAGFEIDCVWPGWGAGQAISSCALRPLPGLGRALGLVLEGAYVLWWQMVNALRRVTGRTVKSHLIQRLEFAGSVHFHARKPNGHGGSVRPSASPPHTS